MTAKNTVLLLCPEIKITIYPPTSASEDMKNTFALPKSMSARAILSNSPSTERTADKIPATMPKTNMTLVQITTFLLFSKKLRKLDTTALLRTDDIA